MRHARIRGLGCLLFLVSACDRTAKEAETAIARADRMVTAVKDRSVKVMPDETKAMVDSLQAAKARDAAGDHRGALAAASGVASTAIQLANAIGSKSTELNSTFTAIGAEVSARVPRIKSRLDQLAAQAKLPAGLTRSRLDSLKTDFRTWPDMWNAAVDDFKQGNLAVAITKATAMKQKIDDAGALLGLTGLTGLK
jgi:hypothetical protein